MLAIAGCKSSDSGDPKSVLNNFFDALKNKNIEEAKKYSTKDSEGMMSMIQMGMNSMPDSSNDTYNKENVEMGTPVINGDKATISVKDKKSGEATDFVLKKEDGAWKVAFDKSTLMGMAQDKMKEKSFDKELPDELKDMNLDSLQGALKNVSKEDMEHARKMLDSAAKMMKDMPKTDQ